MNGPLRSFRVLDLTIPKSVELFKIQSIKKTLSEKEKVNTRLDPSLMGNH